MKISGSLRVLATVGTIQVLVIIINLFRSKFLAVMLGPAGLGVLSVIDQLVQLISYASAFSLPLATGKILSHAHSEGIDAFRLRYASLLRLLVTLTSGGTAVALGLILVRPQLLGSELSPYRLVVMAAVIRVPIISLHGYFTHVLAAAR